MLLRATVPTRLAVGGHDKRSASPIKTSSNWAEEVFLLQMNRREVWRAVMMAMPGPDAPDLSGWVGAMGG